MHDYTDHEIINLAAYPLDRLESAKGQELICQVQERLSGDGSCVLENFVTPQCLEIMAAQAESLEPQSYAGPTQVSPYYFNYRIGDHLDVDKHHPIHSKGRRNLKQVATDLIPEEHLLSILFRSPLMTHFLGQVLGETVYQNQDRYQSLNINLQDEGGCQQWHFDTAHMVTTLLLKEPKEGGVFEYCPNIRSDQDENFAEVKKVLDGKSDRVKRLDLKAGMLSLFQGHYSIHRVTNTIGTRRRIQGILGYTTTPGLTGNVESSILHYGPRVAEIEKRKLEEHQQGSEH